MNPRDESPVELRCAVAVVRGDAVLLLHRPQSGDWALPGGRPRQRESMGSSARREVREETGLDVHPARCALVLEVDDPVARRRIVELVFVADEFDTAAPVSGEPGREAVWVGSGYQNVPSEGGAGTDSWGKKDDAAAGGDATQAS